MMQRSIPYLAFLIGIILATSELANRDKPQAGEPDLYRFAQIPVLVGGRIKPLDTVARNAMVILRGKQQLKQSPPVSAIRWLGDVIFDPKAADRQACFRIDHPDLLGLCGLVQTDRKEFSFVEIRPSLKTIEEQAEKIDAREEMLKSSNQAVSKTPFQTALFKLRNSLISYQRLQASIQPDGVTNFSGDLEAYQKILPLALQENTLREQGKPFDKVKLSSLASYVKVYEHLAENEALFVVPPVDQKSPEPGEWRTTGLSLLSAVSNGSVDPIVMNYARAGDAWRKKDLSAFSSAVDQVIAEIQKRQPRAVQFARAEYWFNRIAPFYSASELYLFAFLLILAAWLCRDDWMKTFLRSASPVLVIALILHTGGLIARMILSGRPPVTNLYSSAVFIGWGTVLLGLFLERMFRDGLGAACASVIGFVTLIIAHYLSISGDTMEMLQAVLDTNLWLATHVVAVTLGYSAMFFAGLLAIFYVIFGVFTDRLQRNPAADSSRRAESTGKILSRMVYGVICFATLFSFVGTVLGGIWADQSWGRFWGWDPKENGALLIVLWCAIILHCRWGGFIKERGMMALVLAGNIITSFSWFGVNMLGVGLHSYGFMDTAFPWLVGYMLSQLILILIAMMPLNRWRSFRVPSEGR